MGLKVKVKPDDRQPIPPGNYFGVIISVYDIGTQEGQFGANHKIVAVTELHKKHGPAVDGKGHGFTIPAFYTLSLNAKANLHRDVEAITGRVFGDDDEFDIEDLIGLAYRLTIVEHTKPDGSKVGKIGSIMRLDDDDPRPKSEADEAYFELDGATIASGDLEGVPEWIAKLIRRSEEWVAVHGAPKADAGAGGGTNGDANGKTAVALAGRATATDDDIPF
jgi:hypothetical protein